MGIENVLAGAFGGGATMLLDLAAKARADSLPTEGYYVALGIFAVLGAALARFYRETIPHKAFLIGVSAPALIAAGGSVVDPPASSNAATSGTSALFGASVVFAAQEISAKPSTQMEMVGKGSIETWTPLHTVNRSDATLLIKDSSGGMTVLGDEPMLVPPGNYRIVALGSRGATVAVEPLSISKNTPTPGVELEVSARPTFWHGFWEAIGADGLAERSIELKADVVGKPR